MIDPRPKTIFCDIDGTIIKHIKPTDVYCSDHHLLTGTIERFLEWDKLGYTVILTTGRKESLRRMTETKLNNLGIIYDKLIMGLGGGDRILINDLKTDGRQTAWCITQERNKGISNLTFENLSVLAKNYFTLWAKKDIKNLKNIFSENIKLKDWNTECEGIESVVKANEDIFRNINDLSVEIISIIHQNNTVVCQLNIVADGISTPVIDTLLFDEQQKINSIVAYRGN